MGILGKLKFWKHDSGSDFLNQGNIDNIQGQPQATPFENENPYNQNNEIPEITGQGFDEQGGHGFSSDRLGLGQSNIGGFEHENNEPQFQNSFDSYNNEPHGADRFKTDQLIPGQHPINEHQSSNPNIRFSNYGAGRVDPRVEAMHDSNNHNTGKNSHDNIHSHSRDYTIEKSLEVISSKLDLLKVLLENLNQRVSAIEDIAKREQKQNNRPEW